MSAVRFVLSKKEYTEFQSSYNDLDRLFARSYKAKQNQKVIS